MPEQSIPDLELTKINGEKTNLSEYKGQVLLIVNTASNCGFTPQFKGLEALHQKYKNQGLAILGFPCNQFGGQEPGSNQDIQNECLLDHAVSFEIFEKTDVNGDQEHQMFTFLKSQLRGLLGRKIKWNFEKFLVNRDGVAVKRFSSLKRPQDLEPLIQKLLAK